MGWQGSLTHRQFLMWKHWLEEEWNKPSRSDWYLARLDADFISSKTNKNITPDSRIMKFKKQVALTPEQKTQQAIEADVGMMGGNKVEKRYRPKRDSDDI